MNWIEFVAPSGTGKSTLLTNVKKLRGDKLWVTEKEAIREIIENKMPLDRKEWLVKLYLKQNIIGFQKNNLEFVFLEADKAYLYGSKNYEEYIRLFFEYLKDTDLSNRLGTREWSEKAFWFKWYLSLIEKFCLFNYHKFKKLIILDEGIIHNNHYSSLITDRGVVDLPKGLVFIDIPIKSIYEQLLIRKNEIGSKRIHIGMNKYTLEEHLKIEKKYMLRKLELARALKIPHVILNDTQSYNERLQNLNDFINEL